MALKIFKSAYTSMVTLGVQFPVLGRLSTQSIDNPRIQGKFDLVIDRLLGLSSGQDRLAYAQKVALPCLFLKTVKTTLSNIVREQSETVDDAGRIIADTIKNKGLIYVFGTGHSSLVAKEIYSRAGGLGPIVLITDPVLMMMEGGLKSSQKEREYGIAAELLAKHKPTREDCIIIISNSGRNAVPMEMAEEAKKSGLKVIAITSLKHSRSQAPKVTSGKRLFEIADNVLDNYAPAGDASIKIKGLKPLVAPLSTITGVFLWHLIQISACRQLLAEGSTPPVWMSGNMDDSDTHNQALAQALFEIYGGKLKF